MGYESSSSPADTPSSAAPDSSETAGGELRSAAAADAAAADAAVEADAARESGIEGDQTGDTGPDDSDDTRPTADKINALLEIAREERPKALTDKSEEAVRRVLLELSPELHEVWRADAPKDEGGLLLPRIKPTTDPAWIAQGRTTVDIAKENFWGLPIERQTEIVRAGWAVVEYLESKDYQVDLRLHVEYVNAGRFIHNAWISRNEPGRESDFVNLLPEEQKKDIDQVRVGLRIFADRVAARAQNTGASEGH